jgi:hypothetical protein
MKRRWMTTLPPIRFLRSGTAGKLASPCHVEKSTAQPLHLPGEALCLVGDFFGASLPDSLAYN